MRLILSDRHFDIPYIEHMDIEFIDLSKLKIANCIGCFGCWTKTPGKCVIRDDAVQVYPRIAASSHVLYITKIQYGSYDTPMKTMLERAIPTQKAFIRLLHGETHHVQRRVLPKHALILGYGAQSDEERDIFSYLVERNARNMNFEQHQVLFVAEDELEQTVRSEVLSWEKS